MTYTVVYEFQSTESKAKSSLKKIPKIFSHPFIKMMKDGSYAVVAGEYNRKDWADAAVHKLYEHHLWGGILSQ